jgi:DNA-binding transcriptional MerR regulator
MEELMTTEEFAQAARAPISTVRYWRAQGLGPQGFRVGKRVLYRQRDVQKWLDGRRLAEISRTAS